jgi:formylmethanofuran dehydrogenase subunit C
MLTLTTRHQFERIPLEADCLAPDRLAHLSVAQIEKLPVQFGNRQCALADFFRAQGDPSDLELRLAGDCSTVKLIGTQMTGGRIVVEGDVGMHLGAEMVGGGIRVEGNADDWVGAEMKGGRIDVRGNAGHLVGGAYRGGKVGMTGGIILIGGRAGNEIACAMRRGFVVIGGDSGDFAGVGMIAGTVFIFGKPGIRPGAGMKRGTIGLFGLEGEFPTFLPTFRYDCAYQPEFLWLYFDRLKQWRFPVQPIDLHRGLAHRYSGDLLEGGKGEILAWVANGSL